MLPLFPICDSLATAQHCHRVGVAADHLIHENRTVAFGAHNNANIGVIIQEQGLCIPLAGPPVIQVQQQADKQWTPCSQHSAPGPH